MPFVAILGAGDLGGALTYSLSSRARFDEVRLIDPAGKVAVGKALDIRQAGPTDGYSTRVTGHTEIAAAAGAWVVVLADPLAATDTPSPRPRDLVAEVARIAPGALIVCAAATHAALLPALVGSGACPPDLLVGSAPAAVAAAGRALLALACRTSPSAVHVTLTSGTTPSGLAVHWSRTSVYGEAADEMLTREQRDRIDRQLTLGWPPGPLTLASAAARCAEAAWFGSRQPQPLWVVDRTVLGHGSASGAGLVPATNHGVGLRDLIFAPGGLFLSADDGRWR